MEVYILDNCDDYYKICNKMQQDNFKLLQEFLPWLKNKHLSEEVVKTHINNIDFYINQFLLHEIDCPAKEGAFYISEYLGDWFIRKVITSNEIQINANAASLLIFYTFMNEKGEITNDDLEDLSDTIREDLSDWTTAMKQYENSLITDMDDVWS